VVGRGVGIGCLMGVKYLKEFRNTTENFEYAYNICDGEFLLIKFFIVNGHIAQHLWVIRLPYDLNGSLGLQNHGVYLTKLNILN